MIADGGLRKVRDRESCAPRSPEDDHADKDEQARDARPLQQQLLESCLAWRQDDLRCLGTAMVMPAAPAR